MGLICYLFRVHGLSVAQRWPREWEEPALPTPPLHVFLTEWTLLASPRGALTESHAHLAPNVKI